MLLGMIPALLACNLLLTPTHGKWVEGHIDTKQNWAFLARFCFLSLEGQFEYLIEYDRDMGTPNLLLYYDDQSQWPAVYHTKKTCREKESVLNKAGQNQIIKLSHWYPETEFSGCVVKRENKEIPASKSVTTTTPTIGINYTKYNKSTIPPPEPSYYDQFLKTTSSPKVTTTLEIDGTTWYESLMDNENDTTTEFIDDGLWESVNIESNTTNTFENLKDVEMLFEENAKKNGKKIKRSTYALYEHYKQRRLNAAANGYSGYLEPKITERLVVTCHNSRRFRSARERWWFIAISNCDSNKGLDVRYKFMMTNGAEGDFWRLHFSADEFYVLPILITYTFAYVVVMIAVVMCSVELKSRHLLHSTYKLFLISIVVQHCGIVLQTLAYLKYGSTGTEYHEGRVFGQFACGISEMTFILLLVLMAKGYTITRGRLKVSFTVKLTVFMCCYCVTYIILFIYQDKAFDPGEVLYLYESPPGYGLITLRILAWCMFSYATFFTVKRFPEKNMFYCPFFVCGTLWFFAGPLFILTANTYIDKWVRESVVIAVLLFITFSGHIMFLLLTLPVFANKNFPYHVRTTQIGVMQTRINGDSFGPTAYHPHNGTAQTVIIPLTRRTEELIGNMYNEYMATAPPLSLEDDSQKQNGGPKALTSLSPQNKLIQQDSTETNTSEDINPNVSKLENKIFTVDDEINKIQNGNINYYLDEKDLPTVLRPKRNILEPINKDIVAPPSWSLAKNQPVAGAAETHTKLGAINNNEEQENAETLITSAAQHKRVPSVKNGLQQSSGEISTILEGHIYNFQNTASKATMDLFNAKKAQV